MKGREKGCFLHDREAVLKHCPRCWRLFHIAAAEVAALKSICEWGINDSNGVMVISKQWDEMTFHLRVIIWQNRCVSYWSTILLRSSWLNSDVTSSVCAIRIKINIFQWNRKLLFNYFSVFVLCINHWY